MLLPRAMTRARTLQAGNHGSLGYYESLLFSRPGRVNGKANNFHSFFLSMQVRSDNSHCRPHFAHRIAKLLFFILCRAYIPQERIAMTITTRLFGKSGLPVTQVGLGGEGVLRTYGREPEAKTVIEQAAAQGITYFDSAQAYAGSQGYYGNFWRGHQELRSGIFQTSKSAARDYQGARADLAESLETMGLDRLDLWQIHDLRTGQDIEEIEGPGGALQAFVEAKDAGLVRFLGVTGHHAPQILEHAVKNWPVDSVLLPVNPAEAVLGGFLDRVMAAAKDCGLAVIAMKVLGGSHYISQRDGVTAELLLRFALSQEVSTAIVGCASDREVEALARVGRDFQHLTEDEEKRLLDLFRPHARRLAYYRGAI